MIRRKEIEGYLPEDKKDLVEDLYSAEAYQAHIHNKALFMKGLQYGIEFAKLFEIAK